jgi:hypothetical protein
MPPAKKAKAKPAAHKSSSRAKAPAKKTPARKPAASKHSATKTVRASSGRDSDYSQYSGKFTVRLPRSLHQALVDRAEKEGVSLNLFVTNALSRTVAGAKKK